MQVMTWFEFYYQINSGTWNSNTPLFPKQDFTVCDMHHIRITCELTGLFIKRFVSSSSENKEMHTACQIVISQTQLAEIVITSAVSISTGFHVAHKIPCYNLNIH